MDFVQKNNKYNEPLDLSNDWYRELYEFSPLMYFIIDSEGHVLSLNKKGAQVLGYKQDELIGKQVLDVFHPDDKNLVKNQLEKCLKDPNNVHNWEFRKIRKDGKMLWVKESARVISEGERNFIFIICEDISAQKKAEEDLKEKLFELASKNRYEKIISAVTRSVHSSIDLNDVFENAVQTIYENIKNADALGILLVEGQDAVVKAQRGHSDWFLERLKKIPYPKGFTWKTIIDGKPLYCSDTETDTVIGPAGKKTGTKSYVALPIKFKNETIGSINIHSFKKHAFNQEEIALFNIVAQQIEVAIKNAKQAEELRESEERYRTLYDQSPLGVFIFSMDMKITDSNERLSEILKIAPNEIETLGLGEMLDQKFTHIFEKALKGYPAQHENFYLNSATNMELWLSVSAVPLRDADGKILGGMAVVEDVTRRKNMEERLKKSQKLESLGILAGGIAHDFNNLLTSIMGNLSVAKTSSKIDGELMELFQESEDATDRASELISQLLTFSKGGAPVKKLVSNFGDFVSEIAKFTVTGSKAKCEFNIDDDLWNIEVDQGQFSQVIENLVINAQQAMLEGGTVKISVSNTVINKTNKLYLGQGKHIRITIEDNGLGISADNLNKIFDPYFTTKDKGHGLGLFSVYSIVKNHQGQIDVQSKPGSGTKFHIYLPANDKTVKTVSRAAKKITRGKGRILLMDDEELIKKATGRMLKKMGYEVEFASDGLEAIDKYVKAINSSPFDLVIMDLTIPGGMGGSEAIKILKSIDPNVKAVVSSGYSNDPVMSDYKKFGFRDIVKKPYRLEVLSNTIEKTLSG